MRSLCKGNYLKFRPHFISLFKSAIYKKIYFSILECHGQFNNTLIFKSTNLVGKNKTLHDTKIYTTLYQSAIARNLLKIN